MKTWIGGEVDSDVIDSFRGVRNNLETQINRNTNNEDYGDGIISFDVIIVISKQAQKGNAIYNKRTKETNVRVIIDINEYQRADYFSRTILLFNAVFGALEKLKTLNIKNFDFRKFKSDLLNLKKELIASQNGC